MEADFIRWLTDRVHARAPVAVGIGDDAAILDWPSGPCVVTTDMLMDGVDFRLGECAPERAGRKALAVNLSDLAAMGARPVAAFVSVALPRRGGGVLARGLYDGLLALADEYGVQLAGGDTNSWDGPLVISVTAIGHHERGRAWCRRGAVPGDAILVTGPLGGSILGHHLDFTPRITDALWLREQGVEVHAATDLSDGLSLDLSHVCDASGVGAELECDQLPISPAAVRLSASTGRPPWDHALADGEDFELILAVPRHVADSLPQIAPFGDRLTRIGTFISEPGLWLRSDRSSRQPLSPRGFQHQFDS